MLPEWARELIALYESGAASQFVLYGNVQDRLLIPGPDGGRLGSLEEFLLDKLLARFDVVLSYDLGNGIRIEKGAERFHDWPSAAPEKRLPKAPRAAIETLSHYFRYLGNLRGLGRGDVHAALFVRGADLVCPAVRGGVHYELAALALLIREWGTGAPFSDHPLATFLVAENLNDLHPLLANNPRAANVRVPLPGQEDLEGALGAVAGQHAIALASYEDRLDTLARALTGATLASVEALLKTREHAGKAIDPDDLVGVKRDLVERDVGGLVSLIESDNTLEDFEGHEPVKAWIRQDLALWRQGDVEAMPMGYLLCGPVGTGKTFLVHCIAGEAGVPVVKIGNFRDKWIGSTEGNLERIFRLLQALGRSIVFIDEADQTLGRRGGGSGDSGLSGRVYSMIAQEMSRPRNRGRILWVLASSRPDMIEVDLKRPGRVDVKIPLFPTLTADEGFALLNALLRRRGVGLELGMLDGLRPRIPLRLTPGAAEALAVKVYRLVKARGLEPLAAVTECLADYRNPVPAEVLAHQIRLAIDEASDLDFVPDALRREFT